MPGSKVPGMCGMISIIAAVQKQQQQSGNHPITVHCRYAHPSPQADAGLTGSPR